MDAETEARCLGKIPAHHRRVIDGYPSDARHKILEKIDHGYSISDCTYWDVELVMGFSYYHIERNGNAYPI